MKYIFDEVENFTRNEATKNEAIWSPREPSEKEAERVREHSRTTLDRSIRNFLRQMEAGNWSSPPADHMTQGCS